MELESQSYNPCSLRVFGYGDTSLWVGISTGLAEDATVTQPIYRICFATNRQENVVFYRTQQ